MGLSGASADQHIEHQAHDEEEPEAARVPERSTNEPEGPHSGGGLVRRLGRARLRVDLEDAAERRSSEQAEQHRPIEVVGEDEIPDDDELGEQHAHNLGSDQGDLRLDSHPSPHTSCLDNANWQSKKIPLPDPDLVWNLDLVWNVDLVWNPDLV